MRKEKGAPTIRTRFRVPLWRFGHGEFVRSLKRRLTAGCFNLVPVVFGGWMVGADPKSTTHNRAAMPFGMSPRWRVLTLLAVLVPLSSLLVQCGKAPPAETLAANAHATRGDTFEDRFPAPQFPDRFPSQGES